MSSTGSQAKARRQQRSPRHSAIPPPSAPRIGARLCGLARGRRALGARLNGLRTAAPPGGAGGQCRWGRVTPEGHLQQTRFSLRIRPTPGSVLLPRVGR